MTAKNPWVLTDQQRSEAVLSVWKLAKWFVNHKLSEETIAELGGFDDAISILTLEAFQAAEDTERKNRELRKTGGPPISVSATCVSRWWFRVKRLALRNRIVAIGKTAKKAPFSITGDFEEVGEVADKLARAGSFNEVDEADYCRAVREAVLGLKTKRFSDLLRWRHLEGRSVVWIASKIKKTKTATSSWLTKARRAFAAEYCDLFGSEI